jgi:hypothetical protein
MAVLHISYRERGNMILENKPESRIVQSLDRQMHQLPLSSIPIDVILQSTGLTNQLDQNTQPLTNTSTGISRFFHFH